MIKFQAIFFDFDGVLAESMNVKTEAFITIFSKYGDDVVKLVVDHHIENGGISRYEKIQYYYKEYLGKEISEEDLNKTADFFSTLVVDKVIHSAWVKGAKRFLETHYKKIDLYIVTGTPQSEIDLIVKKRNMEKYFKGICGSPEKKDQIMNRLILKNDYDPNNVIFFGDAMSDYYASIKSKVYFIGISKNNTSIFPKKTVIFPDFEKIDIKKISKVKDEISNI